MFTNSQTQSRAMLRQIAVHAVFASEAGQRLRCEVRVCSSYEGNSDIQGQFIPRGDRRMIARTWRGRTTPAKAPLYAAHFANNVLPELKRLAGHRGAYLLRNDAHGVVEFTAITLWESRDAIRAFAGKDISRAHVEPEARAALSDFDGHADHYDVVISAGS